VLSIIEVKEEVPENKTVSAKAGKATLVAKAKKEPAKVAYRALLRSREVPSFMFPFAGYCRSFLTSRHRAIADISWR